MKLTPTTRKILQFIADGGERGRMELHVTAVCGSWPRRYQDLCNAGYVENAMAPIEQPDRVRATETGRAALAEDREPESKWHSKRSPNGGSKQRVTD